MRDEMSAAERCGEQGSSKGNQSPGPEHMRTRNGSQHACREMPLKNFEASKLSAHWERRRDRASRYATLLSFCNVGEYFLCAV